MSDEQLRVKLDQIRKERLAGNLSLEEAAAERKQAFAVRHRQRQEVTPDAPKRGALPQVAAMWDPLATQRGFVVSPLARFRPVVGVIRDILALGEDKRDPTTGLFLETAIRKFAEEERDPRADWEEDDYLPARFAVVYALKWRPGPWLAPTLKREEYSDANAKVGGCPFATAAARAKRLYQNGFRAVVLQPTFPDSNPSSDKGFALKHQCVVDHHAMMVRPGEDCSHAIDPRDRVSFQELFSWMPRLGRVASAKEETDKGKVRYIIRLEGDVRTGTHSWTNVQVQYLKPKPNDKALDANGAPYKITEKGKEVWATVPGSGARKTAEQLVVEYTTGLGYRMVARSVDYQCPDQTVMVKGHEDPQPKWISVKRSEALANLPAEKEDRITPFGMPTDADDLVLGFSFMRDEETGEIVPEEAYTKLSARERNAITLREMHDTHVRSVQDNHMGDYGETLQTWDHNEDGTLVEVPRKKKRKPRKTFRSHWGTAKDSPRGGTWDRRHNAEDNFHRDLDR